MLKWRQKIHPSGSPFVIIRKLRDAKPWSSVLIFVSHARTWVRFVDSDIASAAGSLIVWSESSFIVIASKALVCLRMCVVSPEPSGLDDTMRTERLYKNTAIPCSRADNLRPQGGGGGGVCAPLIPENNALISPNHWKKIPQLPKSIFSLLPKSLKLIHLLPKSSKI